MTEYKKNDRSLINHFFVEVVTNVDGNEEAAQAQKDLLFSLLQNKIVPYTLLQGKKYLKCAAFIFIYLWINLFFPNIPIILTGTTDWFQMRKFSFTSSQGHGAFAVAFKIHENDSSWQDTAAYLLGPSWHSILIGEEEESDAEE